jgi:hypothetical protein
MLMLSLACRSSDAAAGVQHGPGCSWCAEQLGRQACMPGDAAAGAATCDDVINHAGRVWVGGLSRCTTGRFV